MRKLSPDEDALWQRVAATIRPLGGTGNRPESPAPPPPVKSALIPRNAPKTRAAARPSLTLGDNLDGGWEKRIRSGAIEPDRSLDLHGFSVDQAYGAIDGALDRAWRAGERVVLLVTGVARGNVSDTGRGKIRAVLADWLGASRHAPHIAAIRGAHPRHGGRGAVYVILRRR